MNDTNTQEKTGEELRSLADRISNAIERGKFTAAELQAALAKRSKIVAHKTDELVHDYPWTAIGIGVGVGVLIGMLAARATQPERDDYQENSAQIHTGDGNEEAESSGWDKLHAMLPIAVFALRTLQELRGLRGPGRR